MGKRVRFSIYAPDSSQAPPSPCLLPKRLFYKETPAHCSHLLRLARGNAPLQSSLFYTETTFTFAKRKHHLCEAQISLQRNITCPQGQTSLQNLHAGFALVASPTGAAIVRATARLLTRDLRHDGLIDGIHQFIDDLLCAVQLYEARMLRDHRIKLVNA